MKKTVKTDFAIDDLKAIRIAGRLFEQFYNRKGIFKDYSMPEYVLPRNLKERSREHALFLTYVISIDYMTDAEKLWKKSRGAYELTQPHIEAPVCSSGSHTCILMGFRNSMLTVNWAVTYLPIQKGSACC